MREAVRHLLVANFARAWIRPCTGCLVEIQLDRQSLARPKGACALIVGSTSSPPTRDLPSLVRVCHSRLAVHEPMSAAVMDTDPVSGVALRC